MVTAAKSPSTTDDLYLEDEGSGGYPEDDDDFSSGSGSGKILQFKRMTHFSPSTVVVFLESIARLSSWLCGLLCFCVIDLVLLSGAGEEKEVLVTANTLFIAPKAKPTQDTTKDFTPRAETFTARNWDQTRELPRQPVRTEVGLKPERFLFF